MCVQTPSCKKMQSCKNQIRLFPSLWSNCFFKEKHKGCDKVHQKSISHLMFKLPIHRLLLQLNRHQGWELSPVLFDLKKVKVESYPFSGNRFPKIFKTPSPLLLLPPLLTSPSNQVDSPPPCSYILMTNPSESPLRNIRHFCTKLSEISVQNRFVGRSVSCQWLTIGHRTPCPGVKSVHTVHTFAGTYILSAGAYVACPCFCVLYDLHQNHCGAALIHTSYLSFCLHRQNFWRIKFTPKFTQ